MSRSLCLAGMMGSGKSTVGRLVAERLGRRFVDTDREVERWAGASVAELFRDRGEEAFRRLEHEVVVELARYPDLVIALGGGAVLRDDSVEALGMSGAIVLLDAPVERLAARVGRRPELRPLLTATGDARVAEGPADPAIVAERLAAIKAAREERYRAVADAVIDADAASSEVAERVLAWAAAAGDVLTPSEHEQVAA